MLTGQTIKSHHADIFTFLNGNLQTQANHCDTPAEALAGSLVYASTPEQAAQAMLRRPAILIVPYFMRESIDASTSVETCCFAASDISMAMARLLKYFDQKRFRFTQWGERHATAVIHPTAKIGTDV